MNTQYILRHSICVHRASSVYPQIRSVGYALERDDTIGVAESTIKYLIISWVVKGSALFVTDGNVLNVEAGYCAVICPPTRYHIKLGEGCEVCWITIKAKRMDLHCINSGLWTGVFKYPHPPVQQLEDMERRIEEANRTGIDTWIKSISMVLLSNYAEELLRHAPDRRLHKAQRLVHQSIDQYSFGTEILANEMSMNRKTLYCMFKKHTGGSVGEYIRRLKMHRICCLLRYTELPLGTIAKEVGFMNTAYFTKAFEQMFGKKVTEFMEHPCCETYSCPLRDSDSCEYLSGKDCGELGWEKICPCGM
ncbi:MAG: helix-turn-helix transcriptional regulator [Pontiella sp.]